VGGCVCVSGRVAVCQDFGLTMAPAATSRIVVLTFCYNESTGTPVHYRIGKPLALLTNDFHTPKAVPSNESSPTNTGIAAMNVRALLESAKLEIKIGASGWTLVRPISTNTTTYSAAVAETNIMRHPNRSKNSPTTGVRTIGITLWRDELYPAASFEVPRVAVWMSARFEV
jgi:hypothetical protein